MTAKCALDNASLWIGDGTGYRGHVVIAGGRIEAVGRGPYSGELPVTDLQGAALSPGMIDLMLLGGFGKSIMRDDPLAIARQAVRMGVTTLQFAGGMLGWEGNSRVAANIRTAMKHDGPDAAAVVGWYPEGPFEHPQMTGASLSEFAIPPTPPNVRRMLDEMGATFRMINVSPGTEDDLTAIGSLVAAGKFVAMAHSSVPSDRALRCVEAGVSILGHYHCNNRGPWDEMHRWVPSIDEVGLTDERVRFVHIICDGVHVQPVLVRLVIRCRGLEAICLVTDAHPSTGCPDGPFTWDDGRTFYKKGVCARDEDGGLAGSTMMIPDHFRNFVKFSGEPPQRAIRTVTLNCAACIGLDDSRGLLKPRYVADLVAWDDQLNVRRVWRAGREIDAVLDLAEVRM